MNGKKEKKKLGVKRKKEDRMQGRKEGVKNEERDTSVGFGDS